MSIPTGVLKPTRIGGGFEKESVLTYIDELQKKNNELEDENKELREAQSAEQNQFRIISVEKKKQNAVPQMPNVKPKKKYRLRRKKLLNLKENSTKQQRKLLNSPKHSKAKKKPASLILKKSENSSKKLKPAVLMKISSENISRKLWN